MIVTWDESSQSTMERMHRVAFGQHMAHSCTLDPRARAGSFEERLDGRLQRSGQTCAEINAVKPNVKTKIKAKVENKVESVVK